MKVVTTAMSFLILFIIFILPINAFSGGTIRGTARYCLPLEDTRAIVYIPSRQFYLKTRDTGWFFFKNVPGGFHDLVFEFLNQPPFTLSDVRVVNQNVTRLGVIDVCPDGDGDGFNRRDDCNDSDPDTNPNATEVCNNRDNDCDGVRDNGLEPDSSVTISITSPDNGGVASDVTFAGLFFGTDCGGPDSIEIVDLPRRLNVIVDNPNSFAITPNIFVTDPNGTKKLLMGNPPPNHVCFNDNCTGVCCSLGSSSGSSSRFPEPGTYLIEAVLFDINGNIVDQVSITLSNP